MQIIAKKIAAEIIENRKPKRIKVRTLIKKFGCVKRTEECSRKITSDLSELGIYLNPSIMKIGEVWKLNLDDRVTLSHQKKQTQNTKSFEINKSYNV